MKETEYQSKTIEETKIESFQIEAQTAPGLRFDSSALQAEKIFAIGRVPEKKTAEQEERKVGFKTLH